MICFLIFFEIINLASGRLLLVFNFINNGNQADKTYYNDSLSSQFIHKSLIYTGYNIRQKYVVNQTFLSPSFNSREVLALSSDFNQTIENGYIILSGLYPIHTGPSINKKFPLERTWPPFDNLTVEDTLNFDSLPNRFQPIPIHNFNFKEDFFFNSYLLCPMYYNLSKTQKNTTDYIFYQQKARRTVNDLVNKYNLTLNISGYENFEDFAFKISHGIYDNDQKPYLKNITTLLEMVKLASDTHPIQNSLLLTNLISHILTLIDLKISKLDEHHLKYVMYVGEEQIMFALASVLNITSADCILDMWEHSKQFLNCEDEFSKIGSQIAIELHLNENTNFDDHNKYYIKINFNHKSMNVFTTKNKQAPLNEMRKYLEGLLLKNFKKYCPNQEENIKISNTAFIKNKKLQEAENEIEANYEFITALIIIETFLIIVVSVLIYFRRQKRI